MKINDIVNTLTEEEKEQHKELIKECLEREKIIEECNTAENFKEFIAKLILASLPDEKFFKG